MEAVAAPAPAGLDVRDLLSLPTDDVDPSAPLSAVDLRLLVDRLLLHSSRIRSSALSFSSSHRSSLTSSFLRASSSSSNLCSLSSSLSSALSLTQPDLQLHIAQLTHQIRSARRELADRTDQLSAVAAISDLVARIRNVRDSIRDDGDLVLAAAAVMELKGAIFLTSDDEDVDDDEPVVFDLLRQEWAQLFDELQGVLARRVEGCIEFEVARGRVMARDEGELRVALQALEVNDAN